MRPVFTSVLAFVMSIDNFVGGFGMYNKLETELMPAWAYYVIFVVSIYLGGLATIGVQRIPSRAVQALSPHPAPPPMPQPTERTTTTRIWHQPRTHAPKTTHQDSATDRPSSDRTHSPVQAFWYAFGAIAILVGGLELASDGLGTWVLLGFITVWIILFVGGGD